MEGQKRKQRKGGKKKKKNKLVNNKGKRRGVQTDSRNGSEREKEKSCPGPARKNINEYSAGGPIIEQVWGQKKTAVSM